MERHDTLGRAVLAAYVLQPLKMSAIKLLAETDSF